MRVLALRNSGVVWLTLMAGVMAPSSEAVACGYDSPQSVSRGVLNWAYPDSLHVIGAISREVAARRLPLANFNRAGADLFGQRFRATQTALTGFAELLRAASSEPSQPAFSLVLVEPVLWTRFEPSAEGLHAKLHVASAEPGDLVLVTGEAVISEIALGRLAVGEAGERGLIRFYGSEKQKSDFIGTYRHAGGQPIAKLGASHATTSPAAQLITDAVQPSGGNP
ncbi:hypothetical protein [Mesorhizobium delmotii]|uniref:Uncharacterized protein n=1 Tax=Mesorhizobium delmotii TaxID=1631247 RepID=A0A2P9ADL8_9HYPH|nr:hypothetical protein [Mesorhizobium delmotii]SJM29227.1 conserved exported hypothetical protein [Mesorhizobium delmotii]